jgi:hypothetical protein
LVQLETVGEDVARQRKRARFFTALGAASQMLLQEELLRFGETRCASTEKRPRT